MVLVVGSFEKEAEAEQALVRLRGAGLTEDESILIANARPDVQPAAQAETDAPDAVTARASAAAAEPTAESANEVASDQDTGPALDAAASEGATYTRESRDEPAMANTSEKEAESAVNSAALGSAIGVFVGGGAMGPLGIALGAVVGGGAGLAASLVARGLSQSEAEQYEADVLAGRYLVAVETERHSADEVRALLKDSGVQQVQVQS
jgi:hypothetical protein